MIKNKSLAAIASLCLLAACSKNSDSNPTVSVSDGATLTLNGGTGGASAVNAVYVDFSTDTQDSVKRASWSLAFNSGSDFRVMLNNQNASTVVKTTSTDITAVKYATVADSTFTVGYTTAGYNIIDNPITYGISTAIIPEISSTDASNYVYVFNPNGKTTLDTSTLYKIRILRSGTTGYTLQYAKLSSSTYSTLTVTKNTSYNFQYVSLENGAAATVEPAKTAWDIVWGYSMYYTAYGTSSIPYAFSDLVFINTLGGASAVQRLYSTVALRDTAYKYFTTDSIKSLTFSTSRDVIGANWRSTTSTGVYTDRFYVVKDPAGNYYALKFLSMGVASDGGVRGKPVIEYKLID